MYWTGRFEPSDAIKRAHHQTDAYVKVVRRIGSISVVWWKYGKAGGYEVWKGDVCIGHGALIEYALSNARRNTPKSSHRRTPGMQHEGEIMAYRGWCLMGDILTPVTRSDDYETWAGPAARADVDDLELSNRIGRHGGVGLHAVKIEYAKRVLVGYHPPVHGFVGLGGVVIEHELGYRSTIQVVRLLRVVPPVGDVVIRALEDRYQCQVLRTRSDRTGEW